ncbi:hypothetical protein A2U01_0080271, partial [Trifolium medium]|nr:hypothetical protein [Trifolium medium]
ACCAGIARALRAFQEKEGVAFGSYALHRSAWRGAPVIKD